MSVALIRDLQRQVPASASPDADDDLDDPDWLSPRERWLAGLAPDARRWWEEEWVATPMPAAPTQPKLIPIVSMAETRDAVALAQCYTACWPQQENIIRDFELNQQQDTLHGQGMDSYAIRRIIRQRKAEIDAELEALTAQYWRAERERDAGWRKKM